MDEYSLEEFSSIVDDIITSIDGWENMTLTGKRVHLAILREPYLSLIFEKKKTIESRYGKRKTIPYKRIKPGDIIFLKRSGGNVEGICLVKRTWFFVMTEDVVKMLKEDFNDRLCIDDESFWKNIIMTSSYASLMEIGKVTRFVPFKVKKRDQRPWVIVKDGSQSSILDAIKREKEK